MQVIVKASFFAIVLALTGCAALNFGWYKPGVSQQEFAQDKFACMNGSQMQVSTSNVNGTGSTYYGGGDVTCNTYGSTTNCSGGGGYSQPAHVSGSSASYATTNMPLFQACMQARGYVWTNQAEVERNEELSARPDYEIDPHAPHAERVQSCVNKSPLSEPERDARKRCDAKITAVEAAERGPSEQQAPAQSANCTAAQIRSGNCN